MASADQTFRRLVVANIKASNGTREREDRLLERARRFLGTSALTRHRILGGPVTPVDAERIIRLLDLEARPDDSVRQRGHRDHIEQLLRRFEIEALPALSRVGYRAWPGYQVIEVPEVCDDASYASVLHEVGHTQLRCQGATHNRVTYEGTLGPSKCCVTCEVEAWRWAIANARFGWSRPMHRIMRDCVRTYLRFATAAQARAVETLCSEMTYREARLRVGAKETR